METAVRGGIREWKCKLINPADTLTYPLIYPVLLSRVAGFMAEKRQEVMTGKK